VTYRLPLLAVLAFGSFAFALMPHPYRTTIDALMQRFHATEIACTAPTVPEHYCFLVDVASVVDVAEALEAYLLEHVGAIERGAWSSANGMFSVPLLLADRSWGRVELWVGDRPGGGVMGRFEHTPKRRP
jgi:hypothetical protein